MAVSDGAGCSSCDAAIHRPGLKHMHWLVPIGNSSMCVSSKTDFTFYRHLKTMDSLVMRLIYHDGFKLCKEGEKKGRLGISHSFK